jgi:hypothetical protein
MIPKTENIPSIEPKTSSATRLPDSSPMSSVVWIARTSHPGKGSDERHGQARGLRMLLPFGNRQGESLRLARTSCLIIELVFVRR